MIITSMNSRSKTFVIAFSSQPEQVEWQGFLSRIDVKFALLADETDNYYQDGIPGIGFHNEVVDWLNRIDQRYHRPIYLGLSMGAYAALFYNAFTRPEKVIAISPVTGAGRLPDFDAKWYDRLDGRPDIRVRDLMPLYMANDRAVLRTTTIISDGEGTELDRQMSERIDVSPIVIPGQSHANLGKEVTRSGYLQSLIKDSET